jgi:hypothetical protein
LGDSALIVTPGTGSACASTTRPEIVPPVLCAWATAAVISSAAASRSAAFMNRIDIPP